MNHVPAYGLWSLVIINASRTPAFIPRPRHPRHAPTPHAL